MRTIVVFLVAGLIGVSIGTPAGALEPQFLRQYISNTAEATAVSTVAGDGTVVVASELGDGSGISLRRVDPATGTEIVSGTYCVYCQAAAEQHVWQLASEDYRGYVWAAVSAVIPAAAGGGWRNELVLFDDDLDVVRTIDLSTTSPMIVTGVLVGPDGIFASGVGRGTFDGVATDGDDAIVIGVDGQTPRWTTVLRTPGTAFPIAGLAPGAGGGVVTAWSGPSGSFVSQVASDGAVQWNTRVAASGFLFAIAGDGNARVYAGGTAGVLYELNAEGAVVGEGSWGHSTVIYALATRGSDHVIVGGSDVGGDAGDESPLGGTDGFVLELDGNGNTVWDDGIRTPADDAVQDVVSAGRVYASGVTKGSLGSAGVGGGSDAFVAGYTSLVRPSRPTLYPYASDRNASFEWDPPADTGGALTGYELTIQPGGRVYELAADDVYHEVAGLTNGATYTASFVAVNDAGSSDPHVVQFTPWGAPAVPANLVLTRTGNTTATASWNPSAPNGRPVTAYQLLIDGTRTVRVAGTATSVNVTGLTTGTHRFKIRAESDSRSSAYSAEVVLPAVVTPPPTEIRLGDLSEAEGNAPRVANVRVTLGSPAATDVVIEYLPEKGTATAGGDYVFKRGTVTIPRGQTEAVLPIRIKGDRRAEPNETFSMVIVNATGAPVADGTAVVTLLNDD